MNNIPASIQIEAQTQIEKGKFRFPFAYTISKAVPMNSNATVTLTMERDALFIWDKLTASVVAPSDVNGIRQSGTLLTDFPLAGTTPAVAGFQYSDHGLSVKITDTSAGRELTSGFVALETLFTPGYMESFYLPLEWNYACRENTKIRFEINNRDTGSTNGSALYHYVSFALIGHKIAVEGQARNPGAEA